MSAGYALATLATEHLVDILVTTLLLTLGVLLIPQLQGYSIQLVGAAVLAAVSLLVFLVIVRGMESFPFFNRVPVLGGAINSIHRLLSHPLRLFLSFIVQVIFEYKFLVFAKKHFGLKMLFFSLFGIQIINIGILLGVIYFFLNNIKNFFINIKNFFFFSKV